MIGEEMGLGKTVEVAALVLSHPAPPLMPEGIFTADGLLVSGFTPLLNCVLTSCWPCVYCDIEQLGSW